MIARTPAPDAYCSTFDYRTCQERLKEDNKFMSELLNILPNIKPCDEHTEEDSPYLLTPRKRNQKPPHGKGEAVRAKSLEELHARLKELHGKKLDYKDKLIKKKLKNQMKKKRRSKELKRTLVKLPKTEKEELIGLTNGVASTKAPKPVFNSAGKMVFSKFDFRSDGVIEESVGRGKKKEEPRKLVERLKREREAEGESAEKQQLKRWATVVARSRGEKVLDDPELLKKSISRAEGKKRSSQRKWKEREERVRKEKEERQTKRSAAISAKKQEKKTKKLKKAVKKGRVIPGFS
ncbi:surfeit locus protein 6 homolog [Hetaerina americana]|uniref:surfeit locus protein 6 homolog n=1 Tax=Hetaerina americana TaxID=62018 RepID=UPI003A7F5D98